MNNQTALALLKDAENYLSALHGSVARHDNLAANLGCAGCELRDRIAAALPQMAAVHAPQPPADRAALRDRIAQALAAVFTSEGETTQGMRVIEEDPDEGASVRRVRPLEAADAVLAVLPPPVSRADVLREAADALPEADLPFVPPMDRRRVADWLRRMADEATAEHHTVDGTRYLCHTDDHYCPDRQRRMADEAQPAPCAECGHSHAVHRDGDDPVTPGECTACPDDERHDYTPGRGAEVGTC